MVTQERLRELLDYDPETGIFHWKSRRGKAAAGKVAGCLDGRGYCVINVDRKRHYAHRLAWVYVNGGVRFCIDHINGDKGDNRIANLRDVDCKTNRQNTRKAYASNKSTGILGVRVLKGKYVSQIWVGGKDMHLGTFTTIEEAHAAYVEAKRLHHAGCTI